MSTLSLSWHWADRTSALGIAYASELPGEPRSVVLWGILGDRASSGALECALEEQGKPQGAWAPAVADVPLGASTSGLSLASWYMRRYGRAQPQPHRAALEALGGNASALPASLQLRCDFAVPVAGRTLSLRSGLRGWRVGDVPIRPAALAAGGVVAAGGSRGGSGGGGGGSGGIAGASTATITACVGYVFADRAGRAPSGAALLEWAAWCGGVGRRGHVHGHVGSGTTPSASTAAQRNPRRPAAATLI